MHASTVNTLIVTGSLTAGVAVGAVLTKVINDKVPAAKPVLGWISGALVGAGVALLAAPNAKSEVASILATPTDSE